MNQRGFAPVVLLLVVAAVALVVGGICYYSTRTAAVPAAPETPTALPNQPAPLPPRLPSFLPPSTQTTPSPALSANVSSTNTYSDQNGAFSFRYPGTFAVQLNAPNDYLNNELVEIDSPSTDGYTAYQETFSVRGANAFLSYFNVSYSSPDSGINQATCEDPGNGTPSGQSPEASINSVKWFEGSYGTAAGGAQDAYDEYQTYQNGACWGVEFDWVEHSAESTPNDNIINAFEQSILGTFQFSKSGAAPQTHQAMGTPGP